MTKSEILFYYESRQNPNGDPDAENQPRLMRDETIMVTDVRIKRTIRDYAKEKLGYTLFVDYGKDGNPVTADRRAKEIANTKEKNPNYIKILLEKTFDVPLFGGLITIRGKKSKNDDEKEESGSQKLTGPVQFALGRSVNKVNLIQPSITSRFVGAEKEGKKIQHSTIGKFYSVEYALIKTTGAINPANLGSYLEDKQIKEKFEKHVEEIPMILWDGTNQLTTRSKYPQKSVLYIQVDYKDTMHNDLGDLIGENSSLKGMATELGAEPFVFDELASKLNQRKTQIEKIRIKSDQVDITKLTSKLKSIDVEVL